MSKDLPRLPHGLAEPPKPPDDPPPEPVGDPEPDVIGDPDPEPEPDREPDDEPEPAWESDRRRAEISAPPAPAFDVSRAAGRRWRRSPGR